jgi:hypothetical protein
MASQPPIEEPIVKNRIRALAALTIISSFGAVAPSHADACTPPDADATPKVQDLAGFPAGVTGHYALPEAAEPTQLVVYAHGYRNTSDSWVCHLLDAAARGAVAVAVDYRGTGYAAGPTYPAAPGDNRGWFMWNAADDLFDATRYFMDLYPSLDVVGLLGVSQGGNASGLAVAKDSVNGGQLFDYWVDVEGAVNVSETYAEASLVEHAGGTTGAYAGGAREDIENAIGATPSSDPSKFALGLAGLSVITHAREIAGSGLRGIAVVHGVDDGLVPYNQSREFVTAMRGVGMATSMYTVLRRNDWQNPDSAGDEGGTVLSSNVMSPVLGAAGQEYSAPLAGHGWEGSSTHLVIRTGFDVLFDLMDGEVAPSNSEFLVDSELGTVPSI